MMKHHAARPALYAHIYEKLKNVAEDFGWNLVLHGSLNRDLDLIMIPWTKEAADHEEVIKWFAETIGGQILSQEEHSKHCFPHGRLSYVINLNRGEFTKEDPQYYLDISVIPINQP